MHHLMNHFISMLWKLSIENHLFWWHRPVETQGRKQKHKLNSVNKYMLYAVFPAAFSQTLICWFWPAEYLDTSVKHMKSDPVQ